MAMTAREPTGSEILDTGRTPAEWAACLAGRGVAITERSLREKANRLGACCKLGNAMLITPAHMDRILTEGQKCHSPRISEAPSGGSRAGSNGTAARSPVHIGKARERLQKLARGTG